jgi:hypothetical protein
MPNTATPIIPVDLESMQKMLIENTRVTQETSGKIQSVLEILEGNQKYKRAGIVELVDKHEKLLIRGGGAFATFYVVWEFLKVYKHLF